MSRRAFLGRGAAGLGVVALNSLLGPRVFAGAQVPAVQSRGIVNPLDFAPKAKRVIFLYQAGGPSHLETFDYKPKLADMAGKPMPESFTRGQQIAQLQGQRLTCLGPTHSFKPFGKSGQVVCELFPHIGSIIDETCIVRSMWTEQINHDPAHTFMNSGSIITGGGQFVTTGTLKVTLRNSGPLVPYITGGMGGAFSRGRAPSATLKGSYSAGFVFQGQGGILVRFDESDSVSVRLVQPARTLVGVVGGGFTHDLSPRHGLRVDLRLHLRPHAVDTEVSASPAVTTGTPAWRLASAVTPSVQFSNMGSTEVRSSLSGPAISAFRTREGSGVQIDTALTVGYFWRF